MNMADDGFVPPPELAGLAAELTCLICKQLFDGPVSTNCGHFFCSGCIRDSLRYTKSQNQKETCPGCRDAKFDSAQLRPSVAMRQLATAFPIAAANVEALRTRAEDAERRAAAAEQEVAALRAQLSDCRALQQAGAAPGASAQKPARAAPSSGRGRQTSTGPANDGAGCNDNVRDGNGGGDTASGLGPGNSDVGGRQAGHRSKRVKREPGGNGADGGGGSSASRRRRSGGEHAEAEEEGTAPGGGDDGDEDYPSPRASEGSEQGGSSDENDGDGDYSPGSGGASGRGGRKGRGGGQVAGQKRGRGRQPKPATGAGRPGPDGSADRPSGSATASVAPVGVPTAPAPVAAAGPSAAAAAAGSGDCPVCRSWYPLPLLSSHVEMCIVRRELGVAGSAAGPAAAAAAAPAPPQPVFGARGASAGGSRAAAGRAGADGCGASAAAAPPPAAAFARAASPVPPVDIQVPPTKNWHAMSVKEARRVMTDNGLPCLKMEKQEMADLYNRYRTFLLTERDRCSTKTTKQLLAVFLRQDDRAARAKRQPAEAPTDMRPLIEQQNARIAAELAARRRQAAIRAAERAREEEQAGQEPEVPQGQGQDAGQPPAGSEQGPQGQGQLAPAQQADGGAGLALGPGLALAAGPPPAADAARDGGSWAGCVGVAPGLAGAPTATLAAAGAAASAPEPQQRTAGCPRGMGLLAALSARARVQLLDVITIDDSEEEEQERRQPPAPAPPSQQQAHTVAGELQPRQQVQQASIEQEQQPPRMGGALGPALAEASQDVEGVATPGKLPGQQHPQHHGDRSTSAWREGGEPRETGPEALGRRDMAASPPDGADGMVVDSYGAGGGCGGDAVGGLRDEVLASQSDGGDDDGAAAAAAVGCGGGRRVNGESTPGLAACLATPQHGPSRSQLCFGSRARSMTPNGAAAAAAATPAAKAAAPPAAAAAAGVAAAGGHTPPPLVTWAAGGGGWASGAGAGGGGGGDTDAATRQGLLQAPLASSAAAEGLMDISNGVGGSRPGMAASLGMKGPLVPAPSGADGMGSHHRQHHSFAG